MVRFYLEKVISQFTPVYGLYHTLLPKLMSGELRVEEAIEVE